MRRRVKRYAGCLTWGTMMKPLLHLKTAILVAYVALCTHLVLDLVEADPALHAAPAAHVFSDRADAAATTPGSGGGTES